MARDTDIKLQNQVIYSVYLRAHTEEGTFRALIPDLDRIKALGTDIIWLMPIHPIGVKELGCGPGSQKSSVGILVQQRVGKAAVADDADNGGKNQQKQDDAHDALGRRVFSQSFHTCPSWVSSLRIRPMGPKWDQGRFCCSEILISIVATSARVAVSCGRSM